MCVPCTNAFRAQGGEFIPSWQPVLPHVQVTARTVACRALTFDDNRALKDVLSTSIAIRFEGSPQPPLGVDATSD